MVTGLIAIGIFIIVIIIGLKIEMKGKMKGKKRNWVVINNSRKYYDSLYHCYRYRTEWKGFVFKDICHAVRKLKDNKIENGIEIVSLRYLKENIEFFKNKKLVVEEFYTKNGKEISKTILKKIQEYNKLRTERALLDRKIKDYFKTF